jgi:hypothetical protein
VVTGTIEGIKAGVSTFRHRFAGRAIVAIQDDDSAPAPQGRHRA